METAFTLKKKKTQFATVGKINHITKNINTRKPTGSYKFSTKVIKLAANVIDRHLTNKINSNFVRNSFSDSMKIVSESIRIGPV